MKKLYRLPLLLALCLLFCTACAAQPDPAPAQPADNSASTAQPDPSSAPVKADIPQDNLGFRVVETLADFTFTTYDGTEISLYETLAEKELVVINFWASWCGPCGMEFPYMEEAYQQFKDSVEIFALSTEPSDSDAILAKYAAEKGMTFPVGRDSAGISDGFGVVSIPTTVLVDRYGTICIVESGAKTSAEQFAEMFTPFLGEDYAGFTPPANLYCQVEPSTEAELAGALNAEGGSIVFKNVDDDYIWPFVVSEHDGRSVAVSSNPGLSNTKAVITAQIDAQAGQALFIDFSLSCERACDIMEIRLDGELVKGFALDRGYGGYAIPIEETGVYSLEISYIKDDYVDEGDDCLRIDTVAVLSGAEAEAALAKNPACLRHDSTAIVPLARGAKELIVNDPHGSLLPGDSDQFYSFWLVPGGETDLRITVDETVDPDYATINSDFDRSSKLLADCLDGDAYSFSTPIDSSETTGYAVTFVDLLEVGSGNLHHCLLLFTCEEDADEVLTRIGDGGEIDYTWSYADGSPRQSELTPAEVRYTVSCVDEAGAPVPGVMVQICDDSLCQVYTSDDDGLCTFSLPPYAYEVHILSAPEGYSHESGAAGVLPEKGGSAQYVFKKTI